MALDVYAACPCGSNKKLKFCCHGLEGSIEQVVRHQSAKQYKQALAVARCIGPEASAERVGQEPASLHADDGQARAGGDRAADKSAASAAGQLVLDRVVRAGVVFGEWMEGGQDGDSASVPTLLERIPAHHLFPGEVDCRVHGIGRQSAGTSTVPWARDAVGQRGEPRKRLHGTGRVRWGHQDSVHPARQPRSGAGHGDEAFEKEVRKSAKLAFLGCNDAAGGLFAKLAETAESELAALSGDDAAKKRVTVASLWWNAGLCRAWDGDEKTAAEALHRSAKHSAEFEAAAEAETLAQTLGRRGDREHSHRVVQATFKIKMVSKLLTLFDATPLFVRVPQPEGQAPDPRQPVATYRVLDKSPVAGNDSASYSLDSVPRVAAEIVVFASALRPAGSRAWGSSESKETFTDALAKLEAAGGDEIEKLTAPGTGESITTNTVFEKEFLPLQFKRHFEASTPLGIIRRINRDNWSKFLTSDWPEMSLVALGGKTPQQAIGDDAVRVPLAAWLQQIDMYADRFGLPFDVPAERAKYGLPAATQRDVSEHSNVGTLSVLQFARLSFDKLSDQQLVAAFKRAALIQHKGSLRPLLLTIVERTSCHDYLDMARVYRFLSDLGSLLMETSEAIRWLDQERANRARCRAIRTRTRLRYARVAIPPRRSARPGLQQLAPSHVGALRHESAGVTRLRHWHRQSLQSRRARG